MERVLQSSVSDRFQAERFAALILLAVLSLCAIVSADAPDYPMCQSKILLNSNCTLVSPALNCGTYNYNIINVTDGTIVETNTLTNLNGNTYFLTFTQPVGDYQVKLCDDSTMNIAVVEGDGGMDFYGALMLIPMILGLMFLFASWFLSEEEHVALKIALFILSFFCFYVSMHFALIGSTLFFSNPVVQENIAYVIQIFGFVILGIFAYWLIMIFVKLAKTAHEKKMKQENRMRLTE